MLPEPYNEKHYVHCRTNIPFYRNISRTQAQWHHIVPTLWDSIWQMLTIFKADLQKVRLCIRRYKSKLWENRVFMCLCEIETVLRLSPFDRNHKLSEQCQSQVANFPTTRPSCPPLFLNSQLGILAELTFTQGINRCLFTLKIHRTLHVVSSFKLFSFTAAPTVK